MFSVVVPLWNKRHTIAATIRSALSQTFPDYEIIIVNDGSSDGSLDALGDVADARIKIVRQARAGPGAARNAGIDAASAAWIAFLDADDLWSPHHLSELDDIRHAHPKAGLIGTSFVSRAVGAAIPPSPATRQIESINFFKKSPTNRRLLCTSSAAIPRTTYTLLGGFGPAPWGQDTEYWVRIALSLPVAVSNKITVHHQRGTGGITETVAAGSIGALSGIGDIEPAVAFLVQRYAAIEGEDMRGAVDGFLDWKFKGCVRNSARNGDFDALRTLRRVALRPPRPMERMILALARLPRPLARAFYSLGLGLRRMLPGQRI